jgi:hypothetical protein
MFSVHSAKRQIFQAKDCGQRQQNVRNRKVLLFLKDQNSNYFNFDYSH